MLDDAEGTSLFALDIVDGVEFHGGRDLLLIDAEGGRSIVLACQDFFGLIQAIERVALGYRDVGKCRKEFHREVLQWIAHRYGKL